MGLRGECKSWGGGILYGTSFTDSGKAILNEMRICRLFRVSESLTNDFGLISFQCSRTDGTRLDVVEELEGKGERNH